MTRGDLVHVAYLGAFVVSGMLYRGDVFVDPSGQYWAEHCFTEPDGSWQSALHRVHAESDRDAVDASLRAVMEYLHREGVDVSVMTIVHELSVDIGLQYPQPMGSPTAAIH